MPTNILLIGHSWLQGADNELNILTGNVGDLWSNGVYHGGYSLADQLADEDQMAEINAELETGIYDYAGIIDFAGLVANPEENNPHKHSVILFKNLFDQYGVNTVLIMPWAYITNPDMQPAITANEYALGEELGILVAPVGEAFARSMALRPDLQLLIGDGNSHPAPIGKYLRDLVIYAAVLRKMPDGLSGIPNLSIEDEIFLKEIAWETVMGGPASSTPTPTPGETPTATLTPTPTVDGTPSRGTVTATEEPPVMRQTPTWTPTASPTPRRSSHIRGHSSLLSTP